MTPTVDGQVHTFEERGLYDGLFLMRDDESGTYWDHMTGEAVYGPKVGTTLEVGNLLHSRAGAVLEGNPDAMIAFSDRTLRSDEQMETGNLLTRMGRGLNRMFSSTVKAEDDRLPTMDLGMGIWSGEAARYYSHARVLAEEKAVLDTFAGRKTVIFLDPTSYVMSAFHVDANRVWWDDNILRMDNGQYVEGSVLHDADGKRAAQARPLQTFTRWYGFALTFPGAEIYGDER